MGCRLIIYVCTQYHIIYNLNRESEVESFLLLHQTGGIGMATRDQKLFYDALFKNTDNYVEIRQLGNKNNMRGRHFLKYEKLCNYVSSNHLNEYIGIYDRLIKGSGRSDNCWTAGAIFLDFDHGSLEEIKERIADHGIPYPSIIVHSGHGYHIYWVLDKREGHELKETIDAMQKLLGSDKAATDIQRPLRIPDTNNTKEDVVVPCTLVEINDRTVSLEQIKQVLPELEQENIDSEATETFKEITDADYDDNTEEEITDGDVFTIAREVDMVEFLFDKGFENVEEGKPFRCIFDEHEDCKPSAAIITNKAGEHRYLCHSHNDVGVSGKMNLGLVDLWARLDGISVPEALQDILEFVGIDYQEGEFMQQQQEKYAFNTFLMNDMESVCRHYPYLHVYFKRYELEIRALMDYAEENLHGLTYSHNGEALFYISKRYMAKTIADYKHNATLNTRKANNLLHLFSLLKVIARVPVNELSGEVKARTSKLCKNGRSIGFYTFNKLDDDTLSIANDRAKVMLDNHYKLSVMTRDVVTSLFNQDVTREVYGVDAVTSKLYLRRVNLYAKVIMRILQNQPYATKSDVIDGIALLKSRRTKEYHFDKTITEICMMYNLSFQIANRDLRDRFGITGKGCKKVIFKTNALTLS